MDIVIMVVFFLFGVYFGDAVKTLNKKLKIEDKSVLDVLIALGCCVYIYTMMLICLIPFLVITQVLFP